MTESLLGRVTYSCLFSIDGSSTSNFQSRAKIFRFSSCMGLIVAKFRWTMLSSGSLSTSGNCSVCVRPFASNSDRQCIPCAIHTRTSVDGRSVFPKPIRMNMNVGKYELVGKMMPVLRVVRITWKISAIPVASYTQCCVLHTNRGVKVQFRITAMASTPANLLTL